MSWRTRAKGLLIRLLSRLTGRHAVLLPAEAASEDGILRLRAPYRMEGERLEIRLLEEEAGRLEARLLGYEGHFPRRELWRGEPLPYPGPTSLTLDLGSGEIRLGETAWGRAPVPLPGRRFAWELILRLNPSPEGGGPARGRLRRRLTGHYLPGAAGPTDADYFTGDNYVDHAAESAGDAAEVLALLRRHGGEGPVLEIGCATGGVLAALDRAGFEAWGVDFSPWAVERARERLGGNGSGPPRAFVCDISAEPLPTEAAEVGPFGALVLWAVLEHFEHPFQVLAHLGRRVRPGGLLLINTTNADSLGRFIFREDWEGRFDPTHLGVREVGVRRLREELPRLGWEIVEMRTSHVWSRDADPTAASLRDLYTGDARFRLLLEERDLGDFVQITARRRGPEDGSEAEVSA